MDADKSQRSLSRIIDWVLPPAIVGYSCWGLYMSVFHVGVGWLSCHNDRPVAAVIYTVLSTITVSTIVGLVVFLWTLPQNHDTPPHVDNAAARVWFDKFPRECLNKAGSLAICNKGRCAGRVKPPRTHHCSVCQTCRMEWDHHFHSSVGCCLTIRQSKSFLMLLSVTAFGVCFMAALVVQPILQGAEAMYMVSRANIQCQRLWWDWWGSYVVFGGPGGRWILGTALGYWVAEQEIPPNPRQCRYGQPIMSPRISSALTLVTALCLSGFCLVLSMQMGFRLLRGQTTIEALQTGTLARKADDSSSRYIWLPSGFLDPLPDSPSVVRIPQADAECEGVRLRNPTPLAPFDSRGVAFPLDVSLRTYDLGVRKNAQLFLSRPLLWSNPSLGNILREPPEINPKIIELIKQLQTQAR